MKPPPPMNPTPPQSGDRARSPSDSAQILFEQGKLSEKQLRQVKRRQERLNIPQHQAILDLNYASEEDTYRVVAVQHHLPFIDLAHWTPSSDVLGSVPVKIIFSYRMIPVSIDGDAMTLAFSEVPKSMDLANLRLLLGKRIKPALATPSCLHAILKREFGLGAATIERLREGKGIEEDAAHLVFEVNDRAADPAMDATIGDFVDQILREALRVQATDIHIEPFPKSIRLRYRVDGLMQSVPMPAGLRPLYSAIVSRLKIMADLNIAEKRLPHDGRIAMKTAGQEYDLRLSIIPTGHGEAVCLRILGRQSLFLDLDQLGMEPEQAALFEELTQLPQGMVLLTGPTGSGKTTSLYAALAHANDEGRKIITIEDPVEYQLDGICQIQVRNDIGLGFPEGLRSILRHDPDLVLIGEIRDGITAEIAVRAAQTGHLVFSTLHTNDSISAVTRLLEMGIEPFVLGSSLVCTVAQRLARRICRHCIQPEEAIPPEIREEMAAALDLPDRDLQAYRGAGCVECNQLGYRGRVAIYEFFVVSDAIADLIEPDVKTGNLRSAARREGWRTIREQGWRKVQAGLIPIAEQRRLTHRIDPRQLRPGPQSGSA